MYGTEINDDMSNASSIISDTYNSNNITSNYKLEKYIEKIVTIHGKRYKYRETKSGNFLYLYRGENKRNCFEIILDIDEEGNKYAHLDSFYNFDNCCNTMDSSGRDLFLAVVELLRERGNLKYMKFSDNSGKELETGEWIPLADTYFVSMGNTWYGSILPLIPLKPITTEIFQGYVNVVRKNRWDNVYECLKQHRPDISIPINISDIDTTMEGSAMIVFRRIKDAKSVFFAEYGYLLATCCGFPTMSGKMWKYNF